MSQVGIPLIWCVVQVTLIGLVTGLLYAVVRRARPGGAMSVVLAGLASVVVLTTLAFSPWPRWSFPVGSEEDGSVDVAARFQANTPTGAATDPAAGTASDSLPAPGGRLPAAGFAGSVSFWESLLGELSRPAVSTDKSGWSWTATVTVLFLCAGGLAVLWFASGMMAVRGYRRRGRSIEDPAPREQLDVLCAELGCSRAVELRQTDELVTAATVGWRRPVILLPTGWRDWTAEQRRAVLAHEVAHIRAGDYLAVMLGQLGLVLHFYHPLVHWLLGRLRLEQELAADAVAASVSGGQRAYLKAIAELALRQPHRPMAWPARSFLPTRTTFLRRISMLRDSKLSLEKPSAPARVLSMGLVVAFGLLIAGLRGPVLERPALGGPADQGTPEVSPGAEQPSSEDSFDLSYVPKGTGLLVVFRPGVLLGRPEFKELANLPGKLAFPRRNADLLEKLEQLTLFVSEPAKGPVGGQTGGLNMPTLIMRTGSPYDFRKFMTSEGEMETREHMGRTYYFRKRAVPTSGHGYYYPDDRTLVHGSEPGLKSVIAAGSHGLPEFIEPDTWKEFQGDDLLLAVSSTVLQGISQLPEFQDERSVFAPFSPLWESASSVFLGVRLDDYLRVHAVAFGNDRNQARRFKETLKALIVLGQNTVGGLQETLGKSVSEEVEFELLMLDTIAELLDGLQIERRGNVVRLTSSVPIGSADAVTLSRAIEAARLAAARSQSTNNMKQIGLAMHNFHEAYRCFPPAVGTKLPNRSTEDCPPHSWRVAVLPFLGKQDLYEQYRFDQPWDSPENLKVLEQIPGVYRSPQSPPNTTDTCYFALVGAETAFPEGGMQIRDFRDGTSNTLLIVEAKRAVPWTKPEDIPYDSAKPIPELGGYFPGGWLVAFADGSVRLMPDSIDETLLRGMITPSGGEVVMWPR